MRRIPRNTSGASWRSIRCGASTGRLAQQILIHNPRLPMKAFRRPSSKLSRFSLPRCAVYIALCLSPAAAQQAPATGAADDARKLVLYDANKNGRLDPDELATMRADEARAATSAGTSAGETIVELTPFEVS